VVLQIKDILIQLILCVENDTIIWHARVLGQEEDPVG